MIYENPSTSSLTESFKPYCDSNNVKSAIAGTLIAGFWETFRISSSILPRDPPLKKQFSNGPTSWSTLRFALLGLLYNCSSLRFLAFHIPSPSDQSIHEAFLTQPL